MRGSGSLAESPSATAGEASRKVLIVTDSLGNGGAERQMALTLVHLPKVWQARCFSVGAGPFAKYLRERRVQLRVAQRRWRWDPLPFLRLWGAIASWRPDVVHSWGYMTSVMSLPACSAFGVALIDGSIRNGNVFLSDRYRSRLALRHATMVVANSKAGLDAAQVPHERVRVIRNGFDTARIPLHAPPRGDDRFTVAMVGRMTQQKDFAAFINAARILAKDVGGSSVRFLAVGDGPGRVGLERSARDLVEAGVMEFSRRDDVVEGLLLCDCGVLMTAGGRHLEGCSNAILEYMACSLPVVCSRGGGNAELVEHGVNGFMVEAGDAQGLADRLRWLRDHREEGKTIGLRGRTLVLGDYSVERMIAATEDVYREALQRGQPRWRTLTTP